MTLPRILIIDDDPDFCADFAANVSGKFQCFSVRTGAEGLGVIESEDPPDLVVLDLVLEGRDGLEILDTIHRVSSSIPVVMVTSRPSPATEASALERGALYYIPKAAGRAELVSKLEKCLEILRTSKERDSLRREVRFAHGSFQAVSPALKRLESEIIRAAAHLRATVLLTGESGTGKSLLAEEIHRRGPRAHGPFTRVSLPALNREVFESELFGHVKGAFTGAHRDRIGCFEAARTGTVFLDEIGDLPPPCQVKLLTVLEERRITRVGTSEEVPVDVRVVAATNRDLEQMVQKGEFRQDLLGRLSVITLRVPPLREHPEDIPELVRYFLGRFQADCPISGRGVTEEAMRRLMRGSWKRNNVRELRNVLERALVMHPEITLLEAQHFDLAPNEDAPGEFQLSDLRFHSERKRFLEVFRRQLLRRAFAVAGGMVEHPNPESIKAVAELTELPPQTVRKFLRHDFGWAPKAVD